MLSRSLRKGGSDAGVGSSTANLFLRGFDLSGKDSMKSKRGRLSDEVPIAGGTPTVIASGQNFPLGITGDQANIYWTNNGGPNAPTGSDATGTVMNASK
jgi:hypothetical protein